MTGKAEYSIEEIGRLFEPAPGTPHLWQRKTLADADQLLASLTAREDLLEQARRLLVNMTPSERVEFFAAVRGPYCRSCGADWSACKGYCENDE